MSDVDTVTRTGPLGAMRCHTALLWLTLTTVIAVTLHVEHTDKKSVTTTQYTFRATKVQAIGRQCVRDFKR